MKIPFHCDPEYPSNAVYEVGLEYSDCWHVVFVCPICGYEIVEFITTSETQRLILQVEPSTSEKWQELLQAVIDDELEDKFDLVQEMMCQIAI